MAVVEWEHTTGHVLCGGSDGCNAVTQRAAKPPRPFTAPFPKLSAVGSQWQLRLCRTPPDPVGLCDTSCTHSPALAITTTPPSLSPPRATVTADMGTDWRGRVVPRPCCATSPGFLETFGDSALSSATTALLSRLSRSKAKPQVPTSCSAVAQAERQAVPGGHPVLHPPLWGRSSAPRPVHSPAPRVSLGKGSLPVLAMCRRLGGSCSSPCSLLVSQNPEWSLDPTASWVTPYLPWAALAKCALSHTESGSSFGKGFGVNRGKMEKQIPAARTAIGRAPTPPAPGWEWGSVGLLSTEHSPQHLQAPRPMQLLVMSTSCSSAAPAPTMAGCVGRGWQWVPHSTDPFSPVRIRPKAGTTEKTSPRGRVGSRCPPGTPRGWEHCWRRRRAPGCAQQEVLLLIIACFYSSSECCSPHPPTSDPHHTQLLHGDGTFPVAQTRGSSGLSQCPCSTLGHL